MHEDSKYYMIDPIIATGCQEKLKKLKHFQFYNFSFSHILPHNSAPCHLGEMRPSLFDSSDDLLHFEYQNYVLNPGESGQNQKFPHPTSICFLTFFHNFSQFFPFDPHISTNIQNTKILIMYADSPYNLLHFEHLNSFQRHRLHAQHLKTLSPCSIF